MSVYKEAFMLLSKLKSMQKQIFNDAADYGIPITAKDDKAMKLVGQFKDQYFSEESGDTRTVTKFGNNEYTVKLSIGLLNDFGGGEKINVIIEYTTYSRGNKSHPSSLVGKFIGILTIDDGSFRR